MMNSLYLTSRREEYKKEKKTKEKGTILVTNNPTPELYDPRIWSQAAPSWEPALRGGNLHTNLPFKASWVWKEDSSEKMTESQNVAGFWV